MRRLAMCTGDGGGLVGESGGATNLMEGCGSLDGGKLGLAVRPWARRKYAASAARAGVRRLVNAPAEVCSLGWEI